MEKFQYIVPLRSETIATTSYEVLGSECMLRGRKCDKKTPIYPQNSQLLL